MSIEKLLGSIDFSHFSKCKDSLKTKLLLEKDHELDFEALDEITAAGTHTPPSDPKNFF